MSIGAFRAGDYGVIFDGQSLSLYPSATHPSTFPKLVMGGRLAPFGVPAVAGLAWSQLDNDLPSRVGPFTKFAPVIVYCMVGGTTQITLGQSGATIYSTMGSIRDSVEAIVPVTSTFLVIGCTTTPSTSFDAGQETVRDTLNGLVLADASNYFDAVVDFTTDACLEDAGGSCYVDGTHPSLDGRNAMEALISPALDSLVLV